MEAKVYPVGLSGKPKGTKKKKKPSLKKNRPHRKKKGDPFYETEQWVKIRYKALKLSNGKCQCCGRSGHETVLQVDHIKPRSRNRHLELDLSNLQVLCAACNYGKRAWDETDWRPDEMREKYLNALRED